MPVLDNAKHEAVALAYLADPQKVGWRAYAKVYPSCSRHAAENSFARLMKNDEFAARIAETHEQAAQGAVMTANEVLEALSVIARANMQDFMRAGPNGDPYLDFSKLTRKQAAALQEVTVDTYVEGHGDDAREVKRVKFKLAGKINALDLLGKHHVIFTERHLHVHEGIASRLTAALARADGKRDGKIRSNSAAPRARHSRKPARKSTRKRSR